MLDRGWTGHEYFAAVHLVHMNGRMYDTDLRRFLSPDNYVQDPTNTQNYNRYQYGLNNPLKYSDPSGEFLGVFLGILGLGAVSYFTGVHLSGGQYNPLRWNIGTFAKVGGLALLSLATAGIGSTIYAGVLSATGLAGFIGGFTAGAISGAFVGLMSGAGYALAAGQNIVKGALNGAIGGAILGGLLGGVGEGIEALNNGETFWSGKKWNDIEFTAGNSINSQEINFSQTPKKWDSDTSLNLPQVNQQSTNDCTIACIKSADKYYGIERPDNFYSNLGLSPEGASLSQERMNFKLSGYHTNAISVNSSSSSITYLKYIEKNMINKYPVQIDFFPIHGESIGHASLIRRLRYLIKPNGNIRLRINLMNPGGIGTTRINQLNNIYRLWILRR